MRISVQNRRDAATAHTTGRDGQSLPAKGYSNRVNAASGTSRVVVRRNPGIREEARQSVPSFEHVADGPAESRCGKPTCTVVQCPDPSSRSRVASVIRIA
jgi:hypothetical protein